MTNTDLTFITNEEQQNLKARFRILIKDTKFFDFRRIVQKQKSHTQMRNFIGLNKSF